MGHPDKNEKKYVGFGLQTKFLLKNKVGNDWVIVTKPKCRHNLIHAVQ